MLPQQPDRGLRDGERVRRVDPQLRESGGVRLFAGVVHFKHGSCDDLRAQHVEGRGMHHHGGMNPSKRAALQQQDLAAGVAHLFGGRADHANGKADLIRHLRRGQRRSHRRRRR